MRRCVEQRNGGERAPPPRHRHRGKPRRPRCAGRRDRRRCATRRWRSCTSPPRRATLPAPSCQPGEHTLVVAGCEARVCGLQTAAGGSMPAARCCGSPTRSARAIPTTAIAATERAARTSAPRSSPPRWSCSNGSAPASILRFQAPGTDDPVATAARRLEWLQGDARQRMLRADATRARSHVLRSNATRAALALVTAAPSGEAAPAPDDSGHALIKLLADRPSPNLRSRPPRTPTAAEPSVRRRVRDRCRPTWSSRR